MGVWPPGQEDPLEKVTATNFSILAWETPWSLEGYHPWGHKDSNWLKQLGVHAHTQSTNEPDGIFIYIFTKIT